jgi:hypothetical protein
MLHPGFMKPVSIAKTQTEFQIVDTHEIVKTLAAIGFRAGGFELNRTLVIFDSK